MTLFIELIQGACCQQFQAGTVFSPSQCKQRVHPVTIRSELPFAAQADVLQVRWAYASFSGSVLAWLTRKENNSNLKLLWGLSAVNRSQMPKRDMASHVLLKIVAGSCARNKRFPFHIYNCKILKGRKQRMLLNERSLEANWMLAYLSLA